MPRDYDQDERERYWRRQEQNREPQDRWSAGNREEDHRFGGQEEHGRNWRRDEDFEQRRRNEETRGRGGREAYGSQGMQSGGSWNRDQERERENWGSSGERQNWGQERSEFGRDWRQGEGQRWEGRHEGYGREGYSREDYGRERIYGMQGSGRPSQTGRDWEHNRGYGWPGERGHESQQGRGEWGERHGGSQREMYGTGSMTGREGQWGGEGWNQSTGGWRGESQRESGSMQGQHTGRGPRNYKRSDQRVEEDINEQLTRHPMIDASEIDVSVQNCEVTLRGTVDHREAKRIAEDIAEGVFGVKDVNNQIKVKQRGESEQGRQQQQHETDTTGKPRERKAS